MGDTTSIPTLENRLPPSFVDGAPVDGGHDFSVSDAEFQEVFGEDIRHTLDLRTWRIGTDVGQEYRRIEREVRAAVEHETGLQKHIREKLFPRIKNQPNAPKNAGVHSADQKVIEKIHSDLLFRGGMEVCDATIEVHETLPLTIYQMGVTLVSYQGDQGAWGQRLFQHDLRKGCANPVDEAIAILERRSHRNGSHDTFGELARKTILAYAERAILHRESKAPWVMGVGNPVPYELLTGGNNLELMVAATTVIRELVEQRQKFVFVARDPRDYLLLTIAQALRPLEFAIVKTLDEDLEDWLHQRRFAASTSPGLTWDDEVITPAEWIPRFTKRVASKIVVGLFRASEMAPAQIFYAHEDHADFAAHMVLADSVLQEHRGVPMLTDIARHVCVTVFGDSLAALAASAYAAAGVPWRYFYGQPRR
jgi:hypothetical protein